MAPTPSYSRRFSILDLAALGVVLVWGLNFTIVKGSLQTLAPLSFNTLRFGIATLLLLSIMRLRGESLAVERRDLVAILLLGFAGHTLYQALFINGLARTTPAVTSLLMATSPLFVALYGYVLGIERPRPIVLAGIGLSFVGVSLLIVGGQGELRFRSETLLGNLMVLIAAMMWAAYTLGGKSLLIRYSPLKLNALTMIPGTLLLALISIPQLRGQDWAAVTRQGWGGLAYSTLFAVVIGYVLWYTSVQRIGSARTAIYSNLAPVVSTATAWVVLGDRLTPLQFAGAGVVIAGLLLTRWGRA